MRSGALLCTLPTLVSVLSFLYCHVRRERVNMLARISTILLRALVGMLYGARYWSLWGIPLALSAVPFLGIVRTSSWSVYIVTAGLSLLGALVALLTFRGTLFGGTVSAGLLALFIADQDVLMPQNLDATWKIVLLGILAGGVGGAVAGAMEGAAGRNPLGSGSSSPTSCLPRLLHLSVQFLSIVTTTTSGFILNSLLLLEVLHVRTESVTLAQLFAPIAVVPTLLLLVPMILPNLYLPDFSTTIGQGTSPRSWLQSVANTIIEGRSELLRQIPILLGGIIGQVVGISLGQQLFSVVGVGPFIMGMAVATFAEETISTRRITVRAWSAALAAAIVAALQWVSGTAGT